MAFVDRLDLECFHVTGEVQVVLAYERAHAPIRVDRVRVEIDAHGPGSIETLSAPLASPSVSSERPQVTVFGPHPILAITVERRGASDDDIHVHPGGQGVWVTRMAGEMGAHPILCGFCGGETGALLGP